MATREELAELTVDELEERARAADVQGRSSMDKAELVAALADDADGPPPETRNTADLDPNSDSVAERIAARSTREAVSPPAEDDDRPELRSGRRVPTIDESMVEERDARREGDTTPREARAASVDESDRERLRSGRAVPTIDPELEARRDDLRAKADEGGTSLVSLSMAELRGES